MAGEAVDTDVAIIGAGPVGLFAVFQLGMLRMRATVLAGLEGRDGRLEAVVVATLEGARRRLEAELLLPCFGLAMELGPLAGWGLAIERNLVRIDPASAETSLKGVFAVGDIATYPGKLKLILSGFAEAAQAAHAIHGLVFPGRALHFEYSTTKGVPGRA